MENLNKLLLKFSQQVALGMQYLSARGYIHRDLAARNVLVNKYGICKITDFGMSRDLAEENYYVANNRDAIPVKWTAPEALYYKKYSTASDVWSYGCLLYEIWSLGHTPFADTVNREVLLNSTSESHILCTVRHTSRYVTEVYKPYTIICMAIPQRAISSL